MRSTVKLWPARESGLVMHIYYLRRVPGIIIMFQTKYVKSLASAGLYIDRGAPNQTIYRKHVSYTCRRHDASYIHFKVCSLSVGSMFPTLLLIKKAFCDTFCHHEQGVGNRFPTNWSMLTKV